MDRETRGEESVEVGVRCHPARRRDSGAVKEQSIPEVAHDNRDGGTK